MVEKEKGYEEEGGLRRRSWVGLRRRSWVEKEEEGV